MKTNREIKFRAWDKKECKMYKVAMIEFVDKLEQRPGCNVFTNEKMHDQKWIDWPNLTLHQYTGLKDKNGKDICEGDIVKYKGVPYTIMYEMGSFKLDLPITSNESFNKTLHELCVTRSFDSIEVIGNIYENPELIK